MKLLLVVAAVILFVKFERLFLLLAIPAVLVILVMVYQENARKMTIKSILVGELISELEQEGYSDSQIDSMLAAKNLKRPLNIAEDPAKALKREGYSEAQIEAMLSRHGDERPATQ
ncbi:MAG: hypothetical protein ABFR19_04625 [Pseudomonadota bacterium]